MTASDVELLTKLVNSQLDDPEVMAGLGRLFLRTSVIVPSRSDPSESRGFVPLVMDEAGAPYMLVMTTLEGLQRVQGLAPYALQITGLGALDLLESSWGVRIDTGDRYVTFSPSGVARLRAAAGADA